MGRRAALLVAVQEYENEGLRGLAAPVDDAAALAAVLRDPQLCDFEVEVLQNSRSYEITRRVEAFLSSARPADLLVLHFACHGLKDDAGELYLAAADTMPDLLGSTAVEAAVVGRFIRRSRARQVVLFLDCCYGGAFERGLVPRGTAEVDATGAFAPVEPEQGRGRAVITASSAMEYAFEGPRLADGGRSAPSVFTGALVEGLSTGAADRDRDGKVSLNELYDFVYERVREATPNQTPSKWEFGLEGGLVLARNPNPPVVARPLPAELAAAIADASPWMRAAAVQHLLTVASDTDLGLAVSARSALQDLSDDDSRQVATAAAQALARTGLYVSRTEVDLGRVRVGDVAPVAEVRLEGVPLARAVRIRSSGNGFRVSRRDDVVLVEGDTSAERAVAGEVLLDPPIVSGEGAAAAAGQVRIRVTGQVLAGASSRIEPVPPLIPEPVIPEPVIPEPVTAADPVAADTVAVDTVAVDTVAVETGATAPDPGRRRMVVGAAAGLLVLIVAVTGGVLKWGGKDDDVTGGQPYPSASSSASSHSSPSASPSGSAAPVLGLPKVLAHRGGQESAPLQTLPALTAAAAADYGVETDVRWTRDDVPVLVHEPDGGEDLPCRPAHVVESTDYDVLRKDCHAHDDAGHQYPVATMRQAAAAVAKHPDSQFFPELKDDQTSAQDQDYLAVLTDARIEARTVATSFELDRLVKLGDRAEAAGIPLRRMLFMQKGSTATTREITDAGLFAVALTPALATHKYVAQLHGLGVRVVVWTVNDPAGWKQAKEAGADTVLTDKPGAYLKWR